MFTPQLIGLVGLGLCVALLGQVQGCGVDLAVHILNPWTDVGEGDSNAMDPADGNDNAQGNSNANGSANGNLNGNGNDSGPDGGAEVLLTAELIGPGAAKGEAEYREAGSRMRLKIELEDAVPGTAHLISVNGIAIGDLTVGPLGEGEVEFDTQMEPDHLPWPNSLSGGLSAGSVVEVGVLHGTISN